MARPEPDPTPEVGLPDAHRPEIDPTYTQPDRLVYQVYLSLVFGLFKNSPSVAFDLFN